MARRTNILAFLMQCIIIPAIAFAATGHTIRNGGGLGEIEFTGIWRTLDSVLAPCLHPGNFCDLSADQLRTLQSAVKNRPATISMEAQTLYRGESPLSRMELTELAITAALKCEGQLVALDTRALAIRALSFTHFRAYETGQAVALSGSANLILFTPEQKIDLAALLKQKMRVTPGHELLISAVYSGMSSAGLHIDGSATLDTFTRVHFHFDYVDGKVELLVFP